MHVMFLFFLTVRNTFAAAAGVKRQHVNGEVQIPTCIDGAAIDIVQMKGKMSLRCQERITYMLKYFRFQVLSFYFLIVYLIRLCKPLIFMCCTMSSVLRVLKLKVAAHR